MPKIRRTSTIKTEIERVVVKDEALEMLLFLREHTQNTGAFTLSFNEFRLSAKSAEEYYGKGKNIDLDSGIYKLSWYPKGPSGGLVSVVANTLSGLRMSAATSIKVELDKTGEQNGN